VTTVSEAGSAAAAALETMKSRRLNSAPLMAAACGRRRSLHLLLPPGDGLVGRHLASRVLREHVGDDVEVEYLLRRRGGGSGQDGGTDTFATPE